MIGNLFGKDQHEEESSKYDDEDHPGEVQSITELHQGSPKVKWRTRS